MKTPTHDQAARAGRAEVRTCAEVEAVRQEGNAQARPWGKNGPMPQEVFDRRQHISAEERARFARALQEKCQEVHREQQQAKKRDSRSSTDQAKAKREASSRKLAARGCLEDARRRISPPI